MEEPEGNVLRKGISLYLVPTPIGNLDDITLRAIKTLDAVDIVLCEDTRKSGFLMKHIGLKKPLRSFHAHNEHHRLAATVEEMERGATMALISDAGTPGISDPGFLLTRAVQEAGLGLECLPGATAFVPALVKSGLPTDQFIFEGFLPHKKGRQTRVLALKGETRTMVFYESPHRLVKALGQFAEVLGDSRRVSVSRELTKVYEETFNGTLAEAMAYFGKGTVKGEIVIVLAGEK